LTLLLLLEADWDGYFGRFGIGLGWLVCWLFDWEFVFEGTIAAVCPVVNLVFAEEVSLCFDWAVCELLKSTFLEESAAGVDGTSLFLSLGGFEVGVVVEVPAWF
jgi:hypothetical protein